ncbi:MAG: DUF262 domain-containing protein [Sulfuricaulis sp.]|uniref:DUF262 domain-containing protein n=1 Tax=Sulfuricaulis sp. TaxID=2003553 RepID=UPI0034A58AF7
MPTKTGKSSKTSLTKRSSIPLSIKKLMADFIYRIDLDADYQREKVWSKTDQERLLDSIVRDIDIPKLYLAKVRGNKQFDFECIDGKQRLLTLSTFFDPQNGDTSPLLLQVLSKRYTYAQLEKEHPSIATALLDYTLDFVVYDEASLTEDFIREIFRRLQLGIRLNSGEILNSQTGTIRDFVFKEIGKEGPFLRRTNLSDKRYSRQFTLAQICINSFHRNRDGEFVRARLLDLEDFFAEESSLDKKDSNLIRIRKVLKLMDDKFKDSAKSISSRAIAVSAYLFVEDLYVNKKAKVVSRFVKFYIQLLEMIKEDMLLVSQYRKPKHPKVLDGFQKHVLQASVEPSAIKRRDAFLKAEFDRFKP